MSVAVGVRVAVRVGVRFGFPGLRVSVGAVVFVGMTCVADGADVGITATWVFWGRKTRVAGGRTGGNVAKAIGEAVGVGLGVGVGTTGWLEVGQ